MATMKKSFGLLVAIGAIFVFSFLGIYILQNKALSSTLNTNKYHYLQSSLHLDFAKEYIKSLSFDDIDFAKLDLSDDKYNILMDIKSNETQKTVHIFVSSKDGTSVRVYDSVVIFK